MSGDNYIGSKISLISLSDIRYVGVLHSINPLDSTVGLKQVRSFGTEGRRGKPEEEILPSDNVFDYVVFRGSDIKDLQVFEAPPKPATPQPSLPQDPAIMSMSSYPPMNSYGGNNGYMPQPSVQPAAAAAAAVVPTPQQQQQPAHQAPPSMTKQSPLQSSQNYWQQPSPYSPKSTTTIDSQQQQLKHQQQQQQQQQQQFQKKKQIEDHQAKLERDTLEELKAELDESHAMQPTINEAAIEQLAKKVSELNTGDDVIIKDDQQQQQQQQQPRLNNNNNNNNNRRYDNNSNNNNNNNQRRNNNRYQYNNKSKNNNDFSIPTSEFDFEASNAKFNKDEIVKKNEEDQEEEEEVSIPEADNFYNKTSSFFDNISCESKERSERQANEPRRSHFQEERKLNLETFGQATVDQSRYRNNYRGRGGRGGNRGGYYRNNNNNNNNRNNYNNNNGFRQNKDQQQEAN